MSDDLVAQLREQASSDHIRGCQGRQYACDCGYDLRNEGLLEQAATALTEARAEIERLKSGINGIVNCQGPMTRAQVREACAEILDNKTVGLDNQSPFAAALGDWRVRAITMEISVKEAARSMHKLMTRALAAESELSTLRARVREVVGPFSRLDISHTDDIDDSALVFEAEGGDIVLGHLRAARQLNEDLK